MIAAPPRHYREGRASSAGAAVTGAPEAPRGPGCLRLAVSSTGLVPSAPPQQEEGAGGKLPAFTLPSALSAGRLTRVPPLR